MYKKKEQVRRINIHSTLNDTIRNLSVRDRDMKELRKKMEIPMKKETTAEEYLEKIMSSSINEDCPVHRTLELLSGKWRTHIIYELCKHPSMRFGELKKAYPRITNTMLTNTLRDLESLGIIHREQFNEIPPHVEYSLTEKGKALLPVFFEISKWGEENL